MGSITSTTALKEGQPLVATATGKWIPYNTSGYLEVVPEPIPNLNKILEKIESVTNTKKSKYKFLIYPSMREGGVIDRDAKPYVQVDFNIDGVSWQFSLEKFIETSTIDFEQNEKYVFESVKEEIRKDFCAWLAKSAIASQSNGKSIKWKSNTDQPE